MKKTVTYIIFILLICLPLYGQQTIIRDVEDLFDDTAWEDSVMTADSGYKMLQIYGDSTAIGKEIELVGGGGEMYITVRHDSIKGGADAGTLYMGVYRGLGYPDRTGYEWKQLYTFDGSNGQTAEILLSDSTWITKRYPKYVKFKWVKASDVRAGLIVNFHYWIRQVKSKLPFDIF